MTFLQSVFLGIVEGITEFLPISSTGHLILASELIGVSDSEFFKSFEIIIQLGAILSVVVLYWKKFFLNKKILWLLFLSFLPTAILGLIFYSFIKKYLLGNSLVVVITLFIGGIGLILFEKWYTQKNEYSKNKEIEAITPKQAILIGLFQSCAMIPGISRAAATIVGGLFLKLERKIIVEFSFLLAVPTMAAAVGLDILKVGYSFSLTQIILLLTGFFVSFVVALGAIKFLLSYIENHSFTNFGFYRIGLSIVFLLWMIF